MRARHTLLMIAAAVVGCGDHKPATPTEPTRVPVDGISAAKVNNPLCANKRIYPLTENTWELAFTSVNGHTLEGVANDGGTFDYSLEVTPQIASDLEQSAIQGCAAEVRFVTSGEVGTVGNGLASYSASTHVNVSAFGGRPSVSKSFQDGYTAPPVPAGCTTIVCIISKERIVMIPTSLQTTFQPGGKITVHSDATARVNARGTSVWDQALSSFSIPHGSGRNPDGPLLIVTFP